MTTQAQPQYLYPSRSAAGAVLARRLYRRSSPPVIVLGIVSTGVEIAANAAQALSCPFDVIAAAHIRVAGVGVVGAIAEDADAVTDSRFEPKFGALDELEEAMDRARRAIKTERLLFRGQRAIRSLEGAQVVIVDGQLVSPWKALAAAHAAERLRAAKVFIAAAVATEAVQEHVRAHGFELVCPSIILDPDGHPAPFGDLQDPSAERLRSIVLARHAA
jgi:predicted phosphoribosyltransferase